MSASLCYSLERARKHSQAHRPGSAVRQKEAGRQYKFDQAACVPSAVWPWLGYMPGSSCAACLMRGVQQNSKG